MTKVLDFQLRMGDGAPAGGGPNERAAFYDLTTVPIEDGDTLVYPFVAQSGGAGNNYMHVDASGVLGENRTTGPFGNGIVGVNDPTLVSDGSFTAIRRHQYDNSAMLECNALPFTAVGYKLTAAGGDLETDAWAGILFREGIFASLDASDFGSFVGVPQPFPTTDTFIGNPLDPTQIAIFIAWVQDVTSLGVPADAPYTITTDNPDAVILDISYAYVPTPGPARAFTLAYYVLGADPTSTITWDSHAGAVNAIGGWSVAVISFDTPFLVSSHRGRNRNYRTQPPVGHPAP